MLRKVRVRGQRLERCSACGGRFIGIGPLGRLIGEQQVRRFWKAARNSLVGEVRCPSCGGGMRAVEISEPECRFHACLACMAFWFDSDELVRLVLWCDQQAMGAEATLQDDEAELKQLDAIAALELRRLETQQKRGRGFAYGAPDSLPKAIIALFGLPVESEPPERESIPWATWTIAAICILVFLLTWPRLPLVVAAWGFIPDEWFRYGGLTLITSQFLHAGLLHLAVNMYFLLVFGDNVEDRLGWKNFLLLYLCAGVVGDLAHAALEPRSDLPAIGASGAISGLLAYYALAFPSARITIGVWIFYFPRYIEMPAWVAFVLWVGWQLLTALLQLSGTGSVSALAHLGGAAAGVIWRLVYRRS